MESINKNPHPDSWKILVLFIAEIAREKHITHEMIAQRTGLHRSHVTRFLSVRYCPTLETYLKLLKAVEVNIFFEDRESNSDMNVLFEKAMYALGRRPDKLPEN